MVDAVGPMVESALPRSASSRPCLFGQHPGPARTRVALGRGVPRQDETPGAVQALPEMGQGRDTHPHRASQPQAGAAQVLGST